MSGTKTLDWLDTKRDAIVKVDRDQEECSMSDALTDSARDQNRAEAYQDWLVAVAEFVSGTINKEAVRCAALRFRDWQEAEEFAANIEEIES